MRGFKKRICIRPPWGHLVGVFFCAPTDGYVRFFEIPMRSYDWVRVRVQKTVLFSSPLGTLVGRMRYAPTTGYVWPFKKLSCFRPLRGRLWGICNTPLRPGTCDPSKYRCNAPTGYVRSFEIPMRFSNWIRAILRNTDAIPQPDTCDPSKYRWDLSTGGAGIFGRWGGGGYRLRRRRA